MLRYALAAAAALALISTGAFAEVGDAGTTKVITKASPDGMAQKKVIIHRHDNGWGASKKVVIKRHDMGYGGLVTKKKIIRGDNMYGSSMPHRTIIKERTGY